MPTGVSLHVVNTASENRGEVRTFRPSIRRRVAVVLGLALAMSLVSACTGESEEKKSPPESDSVTVEMQQGGETTATVAGIQLSIPEGSVASAESKVTISTGEVTQPSQLSDLMVLSPAVHVSLTGQLSSPATLTFPASSIPQDQQPVLVWQDDQGGFELIPTTWTRDHKGIQAQVQHFSFGWLGGFDPKAIASSMAKKLGAFVTGRANKPDPSCGPRIEGASVKSSGGDSVKWCVGSEGGMGSCASPTIDPHSPR